MVRDATAERVGTRDESLARIEYVPLLERAVAVSGHRSIGSS